MASPVKSNSITSAEMLAIQAGCNVVVLTARGRDDLGVALRFFEVAVKHGTQLLDLTQFQLEDALVLTFVLGLGEHCPMVFVKDILNCAQEINFVLDFHFLTDGFSMVTTEPEIAVSVVSKEMSPGLLKGLDAVLKNHGCAVHAITHRSDNMIENNLEYNKLQLRVGGPITSRLSELFLELRAMAWKFDAQLAVRWWDAMNRPNLKSLVVFGLSHVLCPVDIIDETLLAAGVAPHAIPKFPKGESPQKCVEAKLKLLSGKNAARIIEEVKARLTFTAGAEFVCRSLKSMGFRLAISTHSGIPELAEYVKQALGIDYVISQEFEISAKDGTFTGKYAERTADIRFRKADILQLMAEKEGINFRNVISVGEFLSGLMPSTQKNVLEMFGPTVYFNSRETKLMSNLSIVLYLLGFHGADIRALREKHDPDSYKNGRSKAKCDDGKTPRSEHHHFRIRVTARRRVPGLLAMVFAPLQTFSDRVSIITVMLCSLRDGGVCLWFELRCRELEPRVVIGELLYGCPSDTFVIDWDERLQAAPQGREELGQNWGDAALCWQHYNDNRHVVTIVQKPMITSETLIALFREFVRHRMNIMKFDRLSQSEFSAMQITVHIPQVHPGIGEALQQVSCEQGADVSFQQDNLARWARRLIVFDIDSTLIQQNIFDEVAKVAGVEKGLKEITERVDLDFVQTLNARAALLKGQDPEELFRKVNANLAFTPGARWLCSVLVGLGYKIACISDGVLPVAREVQRVLGLHYAFANGLEVDNRTKLLTGETTGPVVTPDRKRSLLTVLADVEGCDVLQTIAVGDNAQDNPMLDTAGLGVAFCAKATVRENTKVHVNQKNLSAVLFLLGISDQAAMNFGEPTDGIVP